MEEKAGYSQTTYVTQPQVEFAAGVSTQPGFIQMQKPSKREWSFELFGCFDDFVGFAIAYLCPLCYLYKAYTDAGEDCCSCCCGGLLPLRVKVRSERGIEGTICNDCCVSSFCAPCAMIQIVHEIKNNPPLV